MKIRAWVLGGVLLVGAAVVGRAAQSEDKKTPEVSPEQMAEMAEWAKLGVPGEPHKHLDYFVGKWKTKTKMWMGGPGSPPMESYGVTETKWVLDGRFTFEHHKGSMMGQPYEGMGFTGYNNFRNVYTSTWSSNMGTEMLSMTGMRHPETGVFSFYGTMDEPSMKVTGRTVKYVSRIVDKNNYVFSIIDLHAGDDYKVIEITYTRE